MLWAPGSVSKVLQLVRAIFEKFGAGPVSWGGLTAPKAVRCGTGGLTALGRVSMFLFFVAFPCCIAAFVQGECALAQGELAYVQEELFVVVRVLTRWFALFA
jgi:hypothetical protein